MPSTSPGNHASSTVPRSAFAQILPGAPTESLQSFTTFIYRFKRYVAYISGSQLNLLSSPNTLVRAITFPHPLVAIAAEAHSGKIIVAGKKDVWILEPVTEGWTKIWWEKTLLLKREDAGDEAYSLSWGNDGEVLVGGSRVLTLFSTLPSSRTVSPTIYPIDGETIEERKALWSKPVARAVRQAEFSPSAAMIASRSHYDRLVKIWRRLSFEEGLFDHTYLPHAGTITHLQWRPPGENLEERRGSGISGRHDEDSEVLYTIANDGILRVWRTAGLHDLDILVLHTTVDLIASIPQSPSLVIKGQSKPSQAPRYDVVLSWDQFSAAVNAAIGISQDGKVNHSKELLKEMSSKELDVVVSFDGQGRMSAWGLQSIGHKRRPDTPTSREPIHISHAEGMHLRIPHGCPAMCHAWFQDDTFNLLTHTITDGEIAWWQGGVETFFSPSAPGNERLLLMSRWCGHDSDVLELQSSSDGIVSRSATDVTWWTVNSAKLLRPRRSFGVSPEVLAATTFNGGRHLLTITSSAFALWDESGQRIAKASCEADQSGRFHITLASEQSVAGLFVQNDAKVLVKWTVTLPQSDEKGGALSLQPVSLPGQKEGDAVSFAVPVAVPFDADRECIVCANTNGRVDCVLLPEDDAQATDFEPFVSFETGIVKPSVFSANEEFAVLASADRKEIVIVDLTDGYIEHRQSLKQPVQRLACFTPTPRHNFLAVAYDTHIEILAQGRYEHHRSDVPIWISVKTISIADVGLDIASIAWLSDGSLVAATGNGVAVASPEIDLQELDNEVKEAIDADTEQETRLHLTKVTTWLKTPLPEWHPSLITYLLHHGHPGLAATLLRKLAQRLKFWSTGEDLTLDESPVSFMQDLDQHDPWLDDDTVTDLREQLEEKDLPRTSQSEQQRLKHIIEALVYIREHVRSLDRHALRYLFNWKLQMLFAKDSEIIPNGSVKANGVPSKQQQFTPDMHWREICFAYHSSTQQALLDILILHHDNKLTWPIARRLGVMAWISEREALETVFEQLGQTAYRSEQPPDPVNASLYFLALHKKPTLLALWRMATWHKEQRTTMNFLKRDFTQPEAKTAARKNAYALMGKRRFEYAAAFFLLAEDPASASSVLAGQCEDVQLGIAVARLYCGDGSPVLRQLLENRILPYAHETGNRWLMSWCHAVMLEKSKAAETLVMPLEGVKTWHQDDPLTMLLYKHLRSTPSEHEYDAVLRSARILRRMGLWLLALELASRWEFKHTQSLSRSLGAVTNGVTNGVHDDGPKSLLDEFEAPPPRQKEPPSMLDNFTQPEPSTQQPTDEKAAREAKAAELLAKIKAKKEGSTTTSTLNEKKPEPTQFKEPDPNSLLDNFGF
ncbi:hypothetical protein M409DRAFT_64539 [Zasmidium cellare ATCC 36951]|uniref:RAVE complex protein Rav1 C-terminal domain-containing protein n=1 Tax=Zasmidium cellare ATCC 36951 TaxID=1080233 RepID=A0A6A6CST0_ZASCE|nr:uncharacterized protein M409DRAFT_64539 [Zasmidium cellare ATCC 36951]KAF2170204.1 hypothetical protein M409DRAFT_64539 [Zasmidium cellare ATCC 36951]